MSSIAVYNLICNLLFLLLSPLYCLIDMYARIKRIDLGQRLGNIKKNVRMLPESQERIWVHAASVGEVGLAKILIGKISLTRPDVSFCLSTMTSTGQTAALQLLPSVPRFLAPLDLPWIARRALGIIRPSIYICLETELWPALLSQVRQQGITAIMLNGRISERSFQRYRLIRKLIKETLSSFVAISAIGYEDAQRFIALGADPTKVFINGNAKYDMEMAEFHSLAPARNRELLSIAAEQKIFLCGSTREGEEELLAPAYMLLARKVPGLIWIIAPRHSKRCREVGKMLGSKNLSFHFFSKLQAGERRNHPIVLIDGMGHLRDLYAIGTYIFVGGSLLDYGGHNIMEAAYWKKPIIYGKHIKDFQDAALMLEAAGAGFRINTPADLIELILRFETTPHFYEHAALAAYEAVASQRGSAQRQADLVADIMQKTAAKRMQNESTHCS